jgi:hypothetical protein
MNKILIIVFLLVSSAVFGAEGFHDVYLRFQANQSKAITKKIVSKLDGQCFNSSHEHQGILIVKPISKHAAEIQFAAVYEDAEFPSNIKDVRNAIPALVATLTSAERGYEFSISEQNYYASLKFDAKAYYVVVFSDYERTKPVIACQF